MVIMSRGAIKQAIESLYAGKAKVYTTSYVTDAHGAQKRSQSVLYDAVPCRLSYDRKVPNDQDTYGMIIQDITLFCDPSYAIPAGAKIDITQNGRTTTYECSGQAAVYESHQEIELTALRKRA